MILDVDFNFGTYLAPRASDSEDAAGQENQVAAPPIQMMPAGIGEKDRKELNELRAMNRLESLQRKKAEAQVMCLECEVAQLRRRLANSRSENALSPPKPSFQLESGKYQQNVTDRISHLEWRLSENTERFQQQCTLLRNRKDEVEEELDLARNTIQMLEKNIAVAEETIGEMEKELLESRRKLQHAEETTMTLQRRMAFVEEEEKRQVREEDESKAALEKKIKSLITRENKLIRSVAEIQFFNENEEVPALISKLKVLMEELNHSQHSLQKREAKYRKARSEFHVKAAAITEEKEFNFSWWMKEEAQQCRSRVQYLEAVVQDVTRRSMLHKEDAAKIQHMRSVVRETKMAAREEKRKLEREFEMTVRDMSDKIDRAEEYAESAYKTVEKLERQIQILQSERILANASQQSTLVNVSQQSAAPRSPQPSAAAGISLDLSPIRYSGSLAGMMGRDGEGGLLSRVLEAVTQDLERSCERYTLLKQEFDILTEREQSMSKQFHLALEQLAENQGRLDRTEAALNAERQMRNMFARESMDITDSHQDQVLQSRRRAILSLLLTADTTLTETTRALFALMKHTAEEKRKNAEAVNAMAQAAEMEMSLRILEAVQHATLKMSLEPGPESGTEELRVRMHDLTRQIVDLCVGLEMAVTSDRHMTSELLRAKETEISFWRAEAQASREEAGTLREMLDDERSQAAAFGALAEARAAQLEQNWLESVQKFEAMLGRDKKKHSPGSNGQSPESQSSYAGVEETASNLLEQLVRADKEFGLLEIAIKTALQLDCADPDKVFGLTTIHEESELSKRMSSMAAALNHLVQTQTQSQLHSFADITPPPLPVAFAQAAEFEALQREEIIQRLEAQLQDAEQRLQRERREREEEREQALLRLTLVVSQMQDPC